MKEKPHHIAAYEFYRDLPKRSYPPVATQFTVSVTSIKKWAKEFKWKMKVAAWDIAIREGVEEGALEALVDTRIQEIERLDRTHGDINASMRMIDDALQQCTHFDEKTGKDHVTIRPETTQDMVSLYTAKARFATAEIKLIEMRRKLLGEVDRHDHTATLEVSYADEIDA